MATNRPTVADLASRLTALEECVSKFEKLARSIKRTTRKKREFTEEQRKAIRARLLAGQEVARKKG
jgi:hypothetical protein